MTASEQRIANLVVGIQNEFLRASDDTLTADDVQQRLEVDRVTCDAVLEMLVEARVLQQCERRYALASRRTRSTPPPPQTLAA